MMSDVWLPLLISGEMVTAEASITIQDAPPYFSQSSQITPNTGVFTNTSVFCNAIGVDSEDGSLSPSYSWEVNGIVIGTGTMLTIDADETDVGDTIDCIAGSSIGRRDSHLFQCFD